MAVLWPYRLLSSKDSQGTKWIAPFPKILKFTEKFLPEVMDLFYSRKICLGNSASDLKGYLGRKDATAAHKVGGKPATVWQAADQLMENCWNKFASTNGLPTVTAPVILPPTKPEVTRGRKKARKNKAG
jgi:hypothetical protein